MAAFVLSASLTYAFVPEAQQFWGDVGAVTGHSGVAALRNHILLGTTGLIMLAFVAVVASRTLYSLRVKTHEATRLGNYVIEAELGSGGMGQVFRARHALIRRPTAVKVMQASGEQELAAIQRFEREVQLSATLTHPNTITIYDFGHTPDNKFYYVMEYLDGLDLQDLVDRYGPLEAPRATYVLAQDCSALSEAHERGIIHRDIKPSNIFRTHRGGLYDFVKVLDFGLAKQVKFDEGPSITKTGIAVGTPRYISPEAVQGSEIDGRSDVYCLGAVAYFTATGRPPFDSSSSVELLIDHMKAIPARPSQVSELPIPQPLDDIIMKCLAKKPEDRFQSAAELEGALRAIPFEASWGQPQAKEWWDLHGLAPAEVDISAEDQGSSDRGISQFIYEP
jgi:serine/threonine-protein kinase